MSKYAFKTIVATEEIRAEFTKLRNELNAGDKELMQAIWDIATDYLDMIKARVVEIQEQQVAQRQVAKAAKVAMKKAAKTPSKRGRKPKEVKEPTAKKATKKAVKRSVINVNEVATTIDPLDADDTPVLVIDGTVE